eukprot:scaffold255252_cov30-Tisochrysis_lutea.AAC.3
MSASDARLVVDQDVTPNRRLVAGHDDSHSRALAKMSDDPLILLGGAPFGGQYRRRAEVHTQADADHAANGIDSAGSRWQLRKEAAPMEDLDCALSILGWHAILHSI